MPAVAVILEGQTLSIIIGFKECVNGILWCNQITLNITNNLEYNGRLYNAEIRDEIRQTSEENQKRKQ